ncbi:MAG: hypothetical protein HY238_23705 [Acidobacteria bacterium]|nr:hypothetical protein [Acidobacteriota bacterium]
MDEAVLRRVVEHIGVTIGPVYGRKGKELLRQRIGNYNQAARFSPWVVLVDLDQEAECAPPLKVAWLPNPAPKMCFRVAVREVEAWLLGDRERLADFLGVAVSRIPRDPEAEMDPKATMVELARRSRRREIREDMVPRPASQRDVGPAYTSRLIEFVLDGEISWRPDIASRSSESLRRCLACFRRLAEGS